MASLSGVSSSNTLSSLMNSANTISGLASGLDTEGMIENLVKSYQTKITQLNQKITKVGWKQDAYRSIIDQLVSLSNKYTSYTSNTNLASRSFFTSSVKVEALGKFADAVTASGKTSSDVSLNAVHQLASAAQYRTSGNMDVDSTKIEAAKAIDLDGKIELSNLNGSMALTYGTQKITISFDQEKDMDAIKEIRQDLGKDATDEQVLAELINRKLADQNITFTGSGNTVSADKRIQAVAGANGIELKELGSAGNGVNITGSSGNIGKALGISGASTAKPKSSLKLSGELTTEMSNREYLSGKTMEITLDGTTKTITLPKSDSYTNADEYAKALDEEVQKAFNGKVKVENAAEGSGKLQLKFTLDETVAEGATLEISSDAGDVLEIGKTATNYVSTSNTLGQLLGTDENGSLKGLTSVGKDASGNEQYEFWINNVKVGTYTKDTKLSELMDDINKSDAGVKVAYSQTTKNFTFTSKETGADSKVEMGDGLAKAMFGLSVSGDDTVSEVFGLKFEEDEKKVLTFEVAGKAIEHIRDVTAGKTMKEIVDELNQSLTFKASGYQASYDDITGKLVAVGEDGNPIDIKVSESSYVYEEGKNRPTLVPGDELEYANASKVSYAKGQDAIFTVTVNGEEMQMTRSSNTVNIDGLSITMNDTFNSKVDDNGNPVKNGDKFAVDNAKESVTFKSTTDSDKIVDAIKSMINEYNAVMSEVKSAFSTMPYQNSNGSFGTYDPLTDEDMESMSESAIARYEEKAKQGILFGDQTLSGLYNKLLDVFTFNNTTDVDTLREMGITVNYSNGLSSISLDEDKLRGMLDSDPDRVADLFTKSDGIVDRMKTQLDNYAKVTGEPKGILIQQAGSPLSSLSLMSNNWQTEIDNYNEQIEKWQTKLESQVERYTSQFTRLEQLINQMNAQSSALAGMLGG